MSITSFLDKKPFRHLPVLQDRQIKDHAGESDSVCSNCLGATCCHIEDAIRLTSFDILRLSTYLGLTIENFLLKFTQDYFPDEDDWRAKQSEDPKDSTVTYLRRRDNFPDSPCIFLKYLPKDTDKNLPPRRICSIHPARPFSCREFYWQYCRDRLTGEMAIAFTEGAVALGKGELDVEQIDSALKNFTPPEEGKLDRNLELLFWTEMRRMNDPESCNNEGCNSYNLEDFQVPIDAKLQNLLSKTRYHLKDPLVDEKFINLPLSIENPEERERLLSIVEKPPTKGIFSTGDSGVTVGWRHTFWPVYPKLYEKVPDSDIAIFLNDLPEIRPFKLHQDNDIANITIAEIYNAILNGLNHMVDLTNRFLVNGDTVEQKGFVEIELLSFFANLETSKNKFIGKNKHLVKLKKGLAKVCLKNIEEGLNDESMRELTLLRELVFLREMSEYLTPKERRRVNKYISGYKKSIKPKQYTIPVYRNFDKWYDSVLDIRYLKEIGFKVDLVKFYSSHVEELERRANNCPDNLILDYINIATHIGYSMTFYNRYKLTGVSQALLLQVCNVASDLYIRWPNPDVELASELPDALYRGAQVLPNDVPLFGELTRFILDSQNADGGWVKKDMLKLPDTYSDYLYECYHATWACIDGLRPMLHDGTDLP